MGLSLGIYYGSVKVANGGQCMVRGQQSSELHLHYHMYIIAIRPVQLLTLSELFNNMHFHVTNFEKHITFLRGTLYL